MKELTDGERQYPKPQEDGLETRYSDGIILRGTYEERLARWERSKLGNISKPQIISPKMDEFLDKVDKLCWDYGYEIRPTAEGWTGRVNDNGEYDTIAIIGHDGEVVKLTGIDGDGRGK